MLSRLLAASLAIAAVLGLAVVAWAQEKAGATPPRPEGKAATGTEKSVTPDAKAEKVEHKIEKATFGGGCFWSTEAIFERIPGVKSVVPGFAGGSVAYPSYELVCTGQTGHAEVVQIEYDTALITYEKLLQIFWKIHDPTTLNAQGDDFGTNYRSIILYHSEDQKQAALKSYKDLTARRVFRSPIVTQLVPLTGFYPAEPYHQDYYRNHPYSEYSLSHIVPKLQKFKLMGAEKKRPKAAPARPNPAAPAPPPR